MEEPIVRFRQAASGQIEKAALGGGKTYGEFRTTWPIY